MSSDDADLVHIYNSLVLGLVAILAGVLLLIGDNLSFTPVVDPGGLVHPGSVLLVHLLGLGGVLLVLVTPCAHALVLPAAPLVPGLVHTALHRGVPDAPLPGLLPRPWPDMVLVDLVVLLLPLGVTVLILVTALTLVATLVLVLFLDVPDVLNPVTS